MLGLKGNRNGKPRLGRVLVVEDDAILAMHIEDALRLANAADIAICPTIARAMEELDSAPAQALIIDVHLADRDDGWALAELVDQLGPERPRIVFSTGSPQDIPPRVAELGPVFEKPYDPNDLVAALMGDERRGLFARLRDSIG